MGRISKNKIIEKYKKEFISNFDESIFSTTLAPGRINIIGEHTDYNLGFAMPTAINRWICSIVSQRSDNKINILASNFNKYVSVDIDSLNNSEKSWEKYIFGCIKIFIDEFGIDRGFNILVGGNIPIGFGMSSSAALEVSLLSSLMNAAGILYDSPKLLELSNRVEHNYLNIKSGLLDQYASVYSKLNKALLIDFSDMSHTYIDMNMKGSSWLLVNSMISRKLVDSKYNERVEECNDALKYINNLFNTDLQMNEISSHHLSELKIMGNNDIAYRRLHHINSENRRVMDMREALITGNPSFIGEILNESHDSLSRNYDISCNEIDSIINISRNQAGFYGGRIMGGGFGGCTINLVENSQIDIFSSNLKKEFYNIYNYSIKTEEIQPSSGIIN
jgi:galactokinase